MSICALYRLIVGGGGVSPAYFFDEMTFAEMSEFIEGYDARRRDLWEQTRSVVHAVFQSQCSSSLDRQEVMKLPWDKDAGLAADDSEKARAALIERAKIMEENLKNGL